ncbi:S-adenosyl-L-methionine-dependent methyltransferase [Rhizodiscina lignyota]|uniref:S-adenosyl-L-methionine-dependent methyltransferase n=1 Tax=Rhizodiscina lignyota TaxID=1504668 RepID=A0A9P4IRB2_9PEZI|nr:S-adenosyl-L-methionine-dependent methyltransferase [Rhizodiscina lignyota]
MSLYYEAADILTNAKGAGGSLKSRVYRKSDFKSKPAQVYALASEAAKWSPVLKEVVEKSGILEEEKKLTALLALLLTHDLLLSKNGVAAPSNHPLKVAITRHKTRLNAELIKTRVKLGFGDVNALRAHIEGKGSSVDNMKNGTSRGGHPRWVRVNTLQSSLDEQLANTFAKYGRKESLSEIASASSSEKVLHVDDHVPDLIALPPGTDITTTSAYKNGHVILQDKASCFPACLLDPQSLGGHVIDATAAPGNKTTHLAALMGDDAKSTDDSKRRIYAYERDKDRAQILNKMISTAKASRTVTVHNQDFLSVDPKSDAVHGVKAVLLDPSCSGSGIVGRDDGPKVQLPEKAKEKDSSKTLRRSSRKRKRAPQSPPRDSPAEQDGPQIEQTPLELDNEPSSPLESRLQALSTFQLKMVTHAMRFPSARRITYSTCSVHSEENEAVVLKALNSKIARELGWRILTRHEQVDGLRRWKTRGHHIACHIAEACIRCEKGTADGTMGFFVAGFVRDIHDEEIEAALQRRVSSVTHEMSDVALADQDVEEEDSWEGFSD